MIGTLNPQAREVTVIGAGISGLLAAFYLDKAGYSVTLLESENRVGGLIRTQQTPWGITESAAHSLLASDPVIALCKDLGVELAPVRSDSKARFVYRGGKVRKFPPLNPFELLGVFLRAYFVLAPRGLKPEELTLEQWGRRFLGEKALQYLLNPFLRGIYGARPGELTVGAAFPALVVPRGHSLLSFVLSKVLRRKRAPRKHKIRGMMSPAQGMENMVQALERRLSERLGSRFRKGVPQTGIPDAPNVILAVPAPVAADLIATEDATLARALRSVQYTPIVSVTVFAPRSAIQKPIRGVGVLMPEAEPRKSLGVLFNSSSFPGRVADESAWCSLTMMLSGAMLGDEEIHAAVRTELREVFGIETQALHLIIHRWERAIPKYNLTLQKAWDAAREGWCGRPGHVLFGNYTGQLSLRGLIESASALAR